MTEWKGTSYQATARLGGAVIHNGPWGEAIGAVRSTGRETYPVGRSDEFVGRSDATPPFPVGKSDRELLARIYYLQMVPSLLPTVVSA